jgi:diguanylate cyclase (GGDEF)-like protein/PAS domain S-box-containing protein
LSLHTTVIWPSHESVMKATAPNRRILLIDDMPSIHDDFCKLLGVSTSTNADLDDDEALLFGDGPAASMCFELDSAFQGMAGLARLKQALGEGRPYAMAFVNLRMPLGCDGVETIEQLWKVDPRLQVVICTAYTERTWESVLQRLDARDRLLVLKMPFDAIEVQQLARTLVTKWELNRQADAQRVMLEELIDSRTHELEDEVVAHRVTEQALRLRDQAIESAFNAVAVINVETTARPIEYVNPAFERITGYTAAETLGRNSMFLVGDDTEQPGLLAIRSALVEHRVGHGTLRLYSRKGEMSWTEVHVSPVRNPDGGVTHCVCVLHDVTQTVAQQAELARQASHDALTGLPNRTMMSDRLAQAIAQARRRQEGVAVLWLDLDHFKFVNDTYGHQAGDELLVALSSRLRQTVRESDTVARLGGDEFVVLMPGIHNESDATVAAQKVLQALTTPFTVRDHLLHVSTSVGVSIFPQDGDDVEHLLMHADMAMYRAKSEGRNGFQFFNNAMRDINKQRDALARALHVALEENQFELHYQPKFDLHSGHMVGAEALLRWRHPEKGMVSPAEFIPVAEESGQIVQIGEWVLRTACTQAREWVHAWGADISMAVNVSARQFRQHDLPGTVRRVLQDTGLDGRHLELELTESLLMQQTEKVIAALQEVKAMGASLALDDFGTGFSSLSYLRRFPIDVIKIDRSFVWGMEQNDADAAIVRAIISMAHSLSMRVVAEGVETASQKAFLQGQQCDMAQGYLLGKPMPAPEIARLWHSLQGLATPTSLHEVVRANATDALQHGMA